MVNPSSSSVVPTPFSAQDHRHMARALVLATQGLWTTSPNPRVGCVIVRQDGQVVGEGWHQRAGEPHAEVHALRMAGDQTKGATAYVTLEPCSHHGRTPPCAEALLAAGIARVVVACDDPNPLVAGQGVARLRGAGVIVEEGLLAAEARELNVGFIARMTRGRPWLRLKAAMSLDGRTALADGRSQWITGAAAREDGHRWRARACAILSGIGTVLADDPQLTVRAVSTPRQPLRVIVDRHLQLPPSARLVDGAPLLVATTGTTLGEAAGHARAQALVARGVEVLPLPEASSGRVDLAALLSYLGQRGINEVHGEAGAGLSGALIAAGLADELLIYQAPCLLGGDARPLFDLPPLADLAQQQRLRILERRLVGEDLRILARFSGGDCVGGH